MFVKTKDIAKSYGIPQAEFENWLKQTSGLSYDTGMMGGLSIDDSDVDLAVGEFERHAASERERMSQQQADLERAAQEKQRALASMLITSGFSFDGYVITKYSGYISGDDVVQIDRGSQGFFSQVTDVGEQLMSSLSTIRRNALAELKEAAYALGCNAVIGVDFDYLTLDPETVNAGGGTLYLPYVFGVTANGNAVVIEEIS